MLGGHVELTRHCVSSADCTPIARGKQSISLGRSVLAFRVRTVCPRLIGSLTGQRVPTHRFAPAAGGSDPPFRMSLALSLITKS